MRSRGDVSQCTLFTNSWATTLPQALRHFPVVMLVNSLVWRNKSWWRVPSELENDQEHTLHVLPEMPQTWRERTFFNESTDVWFICRNTKPRCRLLLQPPGESVGLSGLHLSVPDTQTCHYFSLSVSNRDTNFVAIHWMFKFSLQIRLKDPYGRPNLPAISKIVLCGLRWRLCEISARSVFCVACGRETWMLTSSTEVLAYPKGETTHKSALSHGIFTEIWFEHFVRFKCSFPESKAMLHSLKSTGSSKKLVNT
jgi:hypothetical protein